MKLSEIYILLNSKLMNTNISVRTPMNIIYHNVECSRINILQ